MASWSMVGKYLIFAFETFIAIMRMVICCVASTEGNKAKTWDRFNQRRNWPLRRACWPCPRLRMWACLSLLSLCSSASAQALRLAAAAAPTPRPRRRSSRHLAEPLTPSRMSTLLTCPVRTATSPSSLLLLCRHLPSSCSWCFALALATSFTRMWRSSEASPQAPITHLLRSGKNNVFHALVTLMMRMMKITKSYK